MYVCNFTDPLLLGIPSDSVENVSQRQGAFSYDMRGRVPFKSVKAQRYSSHQENYLNGSCRDSLCRRGNDG